ncbi:MAG: DUF2298 domain-containing protein [Anaerolineales bacterium]|nr:DUF2298 domain-containing protein [Anaerolineales bacterium]
MLAFFLWYLLLVALGLLTVPLTYALFPALADRGYVLARTAGLLIWGYIFWILASFGFVHNNVGGILFALALLTASSAFAFYKNKADIFQFLKSQRALILTTEILFLAAFAFLAFVRASDSELASTEKPMELMFINSILRSETFPPQDAWLSGYAISYYYFGYVMTAMLARLTNIPGSLAHNLMTALVFALGAIGAFGVVFNLLSAARPARDENNKSQISAALFAPLFLLIVSNFEALLEVLHRAGIGWTQDPVSGQWRGAFWAWLDMKELSQPPLLPLGWAPDRYLWWWRASRVMQDYDIVGGFREAIDEFPFFSFLLGDLHPHVLAIPFALLAVAVALNIFLGGWRDSKIVVAGFRLPVSWSGFLFAALVLGGLAFLNTWDILVAAALIVFAFFLRRAAESGWRWARLEDLTFFAFPLAALSLILYFPFYLGFSSQAGGLLPNFMYIARGTHLWVMWGTLLVPIFLFLIFFWKKSVTRPNWKLGFSIGLGFLFALILLMFALGAAAFATENNFVNGMLASYEMSVSTFLFETFQRRLIQIGSLLTLTAVLIPALAFLFAKPQIADDDDSQNSPSAFPFLFLLMTLGAMLILAPEFVYLRDQFGYRINTIFKFYYQAWILWSLVAAFGAGWLIQSLRGFSNWFVRVILGVVIFCGALYPALGIATKSNDFKPPFGYSLDDFARIQRENPEDADAIKFLLTRPEGVVAEAVGGSYSYYGRISTYSGYPAVLGWPGHESQWRGGMELQGSRQEDINLLYVTPRWNEAQAIIEKYHIRYIVIGNLERNSMRVLDEKFRAHLTSIFQEGNTLIYEAPQK